MKQYVPKNIPVSIFLGIILILLFLMYSSSLKYQVPEKNKLNDIFLSNFIHIDKAHLLTNLYSLYTLSRIEYQMGLVPFSYLVVFLLCFNTLVEFISRKIFPNIKPSIGFSGILFGLAAWELVVMKKIQQELVIALGFMVISPSLQNQNVSLFGHVLGALSGVIAGFAWKKINKNEK